ncbi:MAG: 23S rRNA (uracil(1939)-C(5))-methyltransferase RlmD [Oscillospiraceae bacterium]|nr:23S rRNA (uracil(1939)-C(5))-methyltransferase RlmD [Oscillospiraceae bacterium]
MLNKNDIVELKITDITHEGSGVGRYNDMAIFVPFTAVGDEISAKIVKVNKTYAFGIIDKIITPSADRVDNDCPVYNKCGGCSYRHINYKSECEIKHNQVQNNLKRIGKIDLVLDDIIPSTSVSNYRNKVSAPVGMIDNGIAIGFFAKRSHRIINCRDCAIQPPEAKRIFEIVEQFVLKHNISVYDEIEHKGLLRHIFIRKAEKTNEIMVCLVINGKTLPKSDELVKNLTAEFSNIVSVVINQNRDKTNVIMGKRCETIFGKDYITDILCDVKVNISPLAFYQVNHDTAELLYKTALEYANLTGTENVLDLYCGAGTIGLSMAKMAKSIIGVEIIPEAIENAKQNALQSEISNARFICDDVSGAVKTLSDEGICPDVVILDPPRKGCSPDVLDTVISMNPSRIVMVSCNSATLARDLRILEDNGYKATRGKAVDMFPRTCHCECVVEVVRN